MLPIYSDFGQLKAPILLLKLNLSNLLGLKDNITYFAITEHIDGSRFHTVAVWSHIVLTLHYNNVIYKESHVSNSNNRCLN